MWNSCTEGLGEQEVENLDRKNRSAENKQGVPPLYRSLWKETVSVGFKRVLDILLVYT